MSHGQHDEEKYLLERQAEAAYKELFHQFYNALLLYGCTLTDRRPLVEDQIQELFIWVYRNPASYREVRNIEAYLFTALKRKIVKALKKDGRQSERLSSYRDSREKVTRSTEAKWVDRDTEQQWMHWLQSELDQLPPRMREVIYLRYYRCLGYEEIADIMSVSAQVARNFAFRALKKVRRSRPTLDRIITVMTLVTGWQFFIG